MPLLRLLPRRALTFLLRLLLVVAAAPAAVHAAFPGPVQDGAPASCQIWGQATPGMICDNIVRGLGISLDTFYAMNPQLHNDCQHSLWAGFFYVRAAVDTLPLHTKRGPQYCRRPWYPEYVPAY